MPEFWSFPLPFIRLDFLDYVWAHLVTGPNLTNILLGRLMAQNYLLVWSVISPKVCCKMGKHCALLPGNPWVQKYWEAEAVSGEPIEFQLQSALPHAPLFFLLSFSLLLFFFFCVSVLVRVVQGWLSSPQSSDIIETYFLLSSWL